MISSPPSTAPAPLGLSRREARDATDPAAAQVTETASPSRNDTLYDAGLVERFKAGEQAVFDEIVQRHRSRLVSAAYLIIRNSGDAEEIAQDAFVCAHRHLVNFRGECSLASWLYSIARNLARNRYWYFHRRCRHSTLSLNHALNDEVSSATLLDLMPSEADGPLRELVTREFTELVAECMKRLDQRQQTILTLTHTLSYPEIATCLRINIGTVKSRIARARACLRALLAEACPEFGRDAPPDSWFEPAFRRGVNDLRAA